MAQLLRKWLDQSDMRVDDVLAALKPEHFTSGKVPGRSTVSDRLAGIGLKTDFVEAIADICSSDVAARDDLLGQVRSLQERAATTDVRSDRSENQSRGEQSDGARLAVELVMVQKRSLEVSDKLMRALERAQELEKERNSANHMVLLLLTMVDKLQRDITALARERDRLRASPAVRQTSLDHVRARLTRSEQQRTKAESELERARGERHKADRLAEEAAEQVRILTEELDRLRAQVPDFSAETSPVSAPLTLHEPLDTDAGDIDQALAKAARHLDDGAGRLDRLAGELHLDNPPDNVVASEEGLDNHLLGSLLEEPDNLRMSPEAVLKGVQVLQVTADDMPEGLKEAPISQSCGEVLETVSLLRFAGYDDLADGFLMHAGARRPSDDIPTLIDALRAGERPTDAYQLLTGVGQRRLAREVVEVVSLLREGQHDAEAYQVLAAVGRVRSGKAVVEVLNLVTAQDESWVLNAARRDRDLQDLPSLIHALEEANRRSAARMMSSAYTERAQDLRTASGLGHLDPDFLGDIGDDDDDSQDNFDFRSYPTPVDLHDISEDEAVMEVVPKVRPHVMSESKSVSLPINRVVLSVADKALLKRLLPEQQRISSLCERPTTVEEISQKLRLPLGVVIIFVGDLVKSGILVQVATGD
ncbi:DUF742 domain-containing protein [Streptomyces sp. NPDC002033]|uniref:DUF742 domain-containing protein n=1 Tax=unclassified Streptomyces TaxID=2593676 RepID=UPI0033259CC4